ncbi:hypothetical protein Acsp03_14830 [Actinomadura sp. NBRC 104412]|uniref:hypothetical protein n=1 Tax=Actinomadura sp. NBRC 104412 TaxID=3032203 RepID=UPI0024A3E6EA|nr:hypothetical protein [Actinomadura sp. NBRC 104412]GLZ04017.1 hypothetical protein Acsp03_14830 [Actinomadura sp. NBRC 104412]
MDVLVALLVMSTAQTAALLTDLRQVIGLVAALVTAIAAARLGWHGTDRVLARRSRADKD